MTLFPPLFILMKSRSDGVEPLFHTLVPISSSHYTANPLSVYAIKLSKWEGQQSSSWANMGARLEMSEATRCTVPAPSCLRCFLPSGEWREVPGSSHVHTASDQRFWGRGVLGDGHVLWGWWPGNWGLHAGEPPQRRRRGAGQGKFTQFYVRVRNRRLWYCITVLGVLYFYFKYT